MTGAHPPDQNLFYQVRAHPLLTRIEDHFEFTRAGHFTTHIQFYNDLGLPDIQISSSNDAPPEVQTAAERAGWLLNGKASLLIGLRKLEYAISAIGAPLTSSPDAFLGVEYHAENFFIRAAGLIEALHELVALLLGIPTPDRTSPRHLRASVRAVAPTVADRVDHLVAQTAQTKVRRNQAAHGEAFDDNRLDRGLREWAWSLINYGHSKSAPELLDALPVYADELHRELVEEYGALLQGIASLFDELYPLVSPALPIRKQ